MQTYMISISDGSTHIKTVFYKAESVDNIRLRLIKEIYSNTTMPWTHRADIYIKGNRSERYLGELSRYAGRYLWIPAKKKNGRSEYKDVSGTTGKILGTRF